MISKLTLFLLALGFYQGSSVIRTRELSLLCALLSLLTFTFLCLRSRKLKFDKPDILGFILALSSLPIWYWWRSIAGIPPYILGIWILCRGAEDTRNVLSVCLLTSVLYTIFLIFYEHVPLTWYAINFSLWFTHLVGRLTKPSPILGPGFLGVTTLAIFLSCAASFFILSREKKAGTFLVVVAALFLATIANIYLQRPLIYLLICLLITIVLLRKSDFMDIQWELNGSRVAVISLAGLTLFLSILFVTLFPREEIADGEVIIYKNGSFNLERPVFGKYGPQTRGAVFGSLLEYLKACNVRYMLWQDKIDHASLANAKVFVVINLQHDFTMEEKREIWDFVKSGGSLLVLGDHTNISEIMGPTNELLETAGIKLNFDSAIPFAEKWSWYNCIEWSPHPVTVGLRNEEDIRISIGASLSTDWRSVPLLMGRNAFSDPGDWSRPQGAYLGNMRYDKGEQRGGLILVALRRYGGGKVIVFGDTSSFQDGAVAGSYGFVGRIFAYLLSDTKSFLFFGNPLISIFLLTISILLLYRVRYNVLSLSVAALVPMVAVGLSALANRSCVSPLLPEKSASRNVAYVDYCHKERFDLRGGSDNSVSGLLINLERNGYIPLLMKEFSSERLQHCGVFTIIAPAQPFSKAEISSLEEFVEEGRTLVVSVGWEESDAVSELLDHFGLRIGQMPLGAAHTAVVHEEGQKINMREAWPVVIENGDALTLSSAWDYPMIVSQPYGSGFVLAIGDSYFLLDRNLESSETYVEHNIMFLKYVLETFKPTDFDR